MLDQCTIMNRSPTKLAGRLKYFLTHWERLTSDPDILEFVKGVKIEFQNDEVPNQTVCRTCNFNKQEQAIVELEIQKLLEKGVITPSAHEDGEFISTIFLRSKKDGSYRTILNLKHFNEYVQYRHFKMDTLDTVVKMMKPGCYMASIDLKDAYYMLPVHPDHQKFLKFKFKGTLYQYTCLPNGLSSAPRIFTKLLKPVYSTLRGMGHIISGYIDDSYLQGDTYHECANNVSDSSKLITELGFIAHPEKSVTVPSQVLVFLGFILNSITMTVSPTPHKVEKTIKVCSCLLKNASPTITQVAEVIGILISNFPGTKYGPLHYRALELCKINALQKARGDYSSTMTLSPQAKLELVWWIDNIATASKPAQCPNPDLVIKSDASNLGWGAVKGDITTGGRWTDRENRDHINVLELRAAYFALKSLASHESELHIQIQLDNSTAVAYINNMGGTKSQQLNDLALEIWHWCISRSIWLSAVHIAGTTNVEADRKSRHFSDQHEWMLNPKYFQVIQNKYPMLDIDLFASRLNAQLPNYVSWQPDPGCSAVNAFSMSWHPKMFYAFPPFSLISRCVQKILQDKATGLLITPLWPTQTWFPQLLQLLCDQPWVLKPSLSLVQHPTHKEPHPLHKTLRLMVCPVSGSLTKQQDFQQKLPRSSCPPGELVQRNSTTLTSKNGWNFVVKGRLIIIHQQ